MKNIEYKPGYPSDLTDNQWKKISDFFPVGNKSSIHKRSLVEAILYLVDNGCKWRALPHDFPNWSAVKSFYYRAIESGLWEKIMDFLVKETRKKAGRTEKPSYVLIDSQSAKTMSAAKNVELTGEKNERQKTSYCYRYNGKFTCC